MSPVRVSRSRARLVRGAVAVLAMVLEGRALAQEAVEAGAPDAGVGSLADTSRLRAVVVTAQRREEKAQAVSTPLTVLSGDALADTGVGRKAGEVLDYVPNASAASQLHARPRWWIRGVGTGQQALDLPNPIGFYVDEVYIANASATGFPLFDLDRVEVLRGPQGTLWGKNTTGGAVSVVTHKPGFGAPEGYVRLEYGSYNDKIAEGGGGAVLWADHLAARAAFHYEGRDGRFTNLYDGTRSGEFQDAAARVQLLGRVAPGFEALADVHFRKYTSSGGVATVASSAASGVYLGGYVPSAGIDDLSFNAPQSSDIRQAGANLRLTAQLGPLSLVSISAVEEYRETSLTDADNTPLEVSRGWTNARSRQLSEELRLTSPREDRFNWVAGLFYFNETIDSGNASARLPLPGVTGANYARTDYSHLTNSFAPFASASFNILDQLTLSAGLRWTWEQRHLESTRVANATGVPAVFSNVGLWWEPGAVSSALANVYTVSPSATWRNFTYDVTLSWAITPEARVYFRHALGVKSGGFNTAATTLSALNEVKPETLWDFELGGKTSWLDSRLTANAAAFYYDYRDVQINVVGPLPPTNTAVSYIQNAGAARVLGAELELEALPVPWVHLAANLGLLDAHFTDFKLLYGEATYAGNSLVRSPGFSSLVRADVTLPFQAPVRIILGADWHYQSLQYYYTTDQANALLRQGAFGLLNARVTVQSSDEKLSLVLYANNLADERYKNHTLPGSGGATGNTIYWGDPRTLGLQVIGRYF